MVAPIAGTFTIVSPGDLGTKLLQDFIVLQVSPWIRPKEADR
jgi:hypothetical protein